MKYNYDGIIKLLNAPNTKLGDIRTIAKEVKKDHDLALLLWQSEGFFARQLSILIMDKKQLTETKINQLILDISGHDQKEQLHLMEWFMANQLMKDKKLLTIIEQWELHPHPLYRRTFWYYQGRLRWVGQIPPSNTAYLLQQIEKNILNEDPIVQWAMNFTAAQIGIFDEQYRERCINIGLETGLYKDEVVAKNCTPNYLPEYINIQVNKLKN